MNDAPCGHVPVLPDADPTICWNCGILIAIDPETRVWRPLTVEERRVDLVENAFRRWIVVHANHPYLAWTGARWAPHQDGLSKDYAISNFETREEAREYAEQRSFWVATNKIATCF